MLREKINISECRVNNRRRDISTENLSISDDILTIISSDHRIEGELEIHFTRKEGNAIDFSSTRIAKCLDEETITMDKFPDYRLFPRNYELTQLSRTTNGNKENCVIINLLKTNPHTEVSDKSTLRIKEAIDESYSTKDDKSIRRCNGDAVIYNRMFIYWGEGTTIDEGTGLYRTIQEHCKNLRVKGTIIYSLGTYYKSFVCEFIVPVNIAGADDTYKLLLFDDGFRKFNEMLADMGTYNGTMQIYLPDTRFYCLPDDSGRAEAKPKTEIWYKDNNLRLIVPLTTTFSVDLNEEQRRVLYREEAIDASISKIIDYEKAPFTASHKREDKFKALRALSFNLHFRYRSDKEAMVSVESDGWVGRESSDLEEIGFTTEDLKKRAKSLSKSFIRISFYDTPSRNTQNLLYYSTIFLDINKLIKVGSNAVSDIKLIKECIFTAYNKSNIEGSGSEGFYLHLFPNLVSNGKEKELYMKIEFYHAKLGYVIPFILPIDEDKNIIPFEDERFPKNYFIREDMKTDMTRLYRDMYIPVKIREENDEYIWYIDLNGLDVKEGNVVLDFYEPRLIGTDNEKDNTPALEMDAISSSGKDDKYAEVDGVYMNEVAPRTPINVDDEEFRLLSSRRNNIFGIIEENEEAEAGE